MLPIARLQADTHTLKPMPILQQLRFLSHHSRNFVKLETASRSVIKLFSILLISA
jgi:hypothetical protein